MGESPLPPGADRLRLLGRHLRGRRGPPGNQLTLQGERLWLEKPVAAIANHLIPDSREQSRGPIRGVRTQRRAKAFIGPLMSIDEVSNPFVVRILGRTGDAAIVRKRKEDDRPPFPAGLAKHTQPRLGNQVEERRRGHQLAGREEIVERLETGKICYPSEDRERSFQLRSCQQLRTTIDEHPLLRRRQQRREESRIRSGAGRDVHGTNQPAARQPMRHGFSDERRSRPPVGRFTQGQPFGAEVAHERPARSSASDIRRAD